MCDIDSLWSRFWYESNFRLCLFVYREIKCYQKNVKWYVVIANIYDSDFVYNNSCDVYLDHSLYSYKKAKGPFGTPSSLPKLTLGVVGLYRLSIEVMRHIGSLLHLAKRRACMSVTGYWGDIFKHLQSPTSNTMEAVKSFNNEVCFDPFRNFESTESRTCFIINVCASSYANISIK